jgi:hypothetical protein
VSKNAHRANFCRVRVLEEMRGVPSIRRSVSRLVGACALVAWLLVARSKGTAAVTSDCFIADS